LIGKTLGIGRNTSPDLTMQRSVALTGTRRTYIGLQDHLTGTRCEDRCVGARCLP